MADDMTNLIDSYEAAALLNITQNNLRVLVHRKKLVTQGRKNRRVMFNASDVVELQRKRYEKSVRLQAKKEVALQPVE